MGDNAERIITFSTGQDSGDAFGPYLLRQLRFKATGREGRINAIEINGKHWGGSHGDWTPYLDLGANDDYILDFQIYYAKNSDWQNRLYHLHFGSVRGNVIDGGGDGGTCNAGTCGNFDNPGPDTLFHPPVKLLTIAGTIDTYSEVYGGIIIDKCVMGLTVTLVLNYQPSKLVEAGAVFIVNYDAPGTSIETYTEDDAKLVDSYSKVTSYTVSQKYSASVSADYADAVSMSMSSSIEITDSNTESISHQLESIKKTYTKVTKAIPSDSVGLSIVTGNIMQTGDQFWISGLKAMAYPTVPLAQLDSFYGHYDLTGNLDTEIPKLTPSKKVLNGFTYYAKP
jgi:hypothetical protein